MQILRDHGLIESAALLPEERRVLSAWEVLVGHADWTGPDDLRRLSGVAVHFDGPEHAVIDLPGTALRLVVRVSYPHRLVRLTAIRRRPESVQESVSDVRQTDPQRAGPRGRLAGNRPPVRG